MVYLRLKLYHQYTSHNLLDRLAWRS
jgi:hypothetical protein